MQTVIAEDCQLFHASAGRPGDAGESVDLLDYMGTVHHIARQIHRKLPSHIEMDELISAGTMGLMDAFRRFDPGRHIQFKSFAQFRVRGAILDWLRVLDWSPRELRRKRRAAETAIQVLSQRLERTPSEHEIADEMEMKLEQFQELKREWNLLHMESLDAQSANGSGAKELDELAGPLGDNPLDRMLEAERRQSLTDAMERLPERQRLVLTLYYYEELTLKEIGATLGVVESRVSQIRSAAIAGLRSAMGVGIPKEGADAPAELPEELFHARVKQAA